MSQLKNATQKIFESSDILCQDFTPYTSAQAFYPAQTCNESAAF